MTAQRAVRDTMPEMRSTSAITKSTGRTAAMEELRMFHESFNRSIKVAIIAIDLAQDRSGTEATFRDQFRDAAKKASSRWGSFCPKDFDNAANEARLDISRNGVVGVFAAFEVYLESLEKHAKARGKVRTKKADKVYPSEYPGDFWKLDKAHHCAAGVGLDVPELKSQRPLLAYLREVRNCVAHQGALADETLTKIANSTQLKKALAVGRTRRLPKLPTIHEGKRIPLEPEHAIMASSVCFELARAIDGQLLLQYGS